MSANFDRLLTTLRMETLTFKIKSNAEPECAFDDNNEMPNRLLREIDSLMHLLLDEICSE